MPKCKLCNNYWQDLKYCELKKRFWPKDGDPSECDIYDENKIDPEKASEKRRHLWAMWTP